MEIISRREAIRRCLSKYFTGIPCRAGHFAFRYTKNGGCSDCINPKFNSVDVEDRENFRKKVRALKDARTMVRHGFYIHRPDYETFLATLVFYARQHEPKLYPSDVIARRSWISGPAGTQLRQLWIFPEDRQTLQEMETAMRRAREMPATK